MKDETRGQIEELVEELTRCRRQGDVLEANARALANKAQEVAEQARNFRQAEKVHKAALDLLVTKAGDEVLVPAKGDAAADAAPAA